LIPIIGVSPKSAAVAGLLAKGTATPELVAELAKSRVRCLSSNVL
jgi:hypothetical protein